VVKKGQRVRVRIANQFGSIDMGGMFKQMHQHGGTD
jgi:hypothetical protein